jgi:hypothetical protein
LIIGKGKKMEENNIETNESESSLSERKYSAPRLDKAFNAQKNIVKYGKYITVIPVVVYFIDPGLAIFLIIGLIGYWFTYYKNKEDLESTEIELYRESKEDGLNHDISDMKLLWFKFGPVIAFITSIGAFIWYILKFIYNNSQN